MLEPTDLRLITFAGQQPRTLELAPRELLDHLYSLLEREGCVWLRGLAWTSPDELRALLQHLAPTLMRYPGGRIDVTRDGTIQQIADPPSALPLHCELAYTPVRPDVCMFACERPATRGGHTLLADGARIWARLAPATREAFEARRVIYERVHRTRPSQLLHGLETLEELTSRRDDARDFAYQLHEDGSLWTHYVTPAVTRVEGLSCFANSVIGLAKGHADCRVTWEDGEAIAPALLEDVRAAIHASQVSVEWRAGDVVLIDNWRWLHGRSTFEGPRAVLSAFGYRDAPERTASHDASAQLSARTSVHG